MTAVVANTADVPIISPFRTPTFLLVYLPVFIDYFGAQLFQPLVGDMRRAFGPPEDPNKYMAASYSGAPYSAFTLGQLFGATILGYMSDKLNNRKMALMGALLLSAVAYVCVAFAPTYWTFVGARVIMGIAGGSRSIVLAFVTDVVPYQQMPQWAIVIGTLASICAIIAPLIGGHIRDFFPNAQIPFLLNTAMCLLGCVVLYFFLKSPEYYVETTLQIQRRKALTSTTDVEAPAGLAAPVHVAKAFDGTHALTRTILVGIVATAMAASVNSWGDQSWMTLFPVILEVNFGKKTKELGNLMIFQGVGQLVATVFLYVPLNKLIGTTGCLFLGVLIYSLPVTFFMYADNLPMVIALGCCLKMGATILGTSGPVLIKLLAPKSHRGKITGMYVSTGKFLAFVAPLVVGPLCAAGFSIACLVMGSLGLVGLGASLVAWKIIKKFEAEQRARDDVAAKA